MSTTRDVFLCDAIRTPIGRYGGALAKVRADDLAAIPIKALIKRNPNVDWAALDEVVFGCANQAGEDNRNVARMAVLLAGLPDHVPGVTVNRLCASGLNAVGDAARAIRAGEIDFAIAGGVESMTRAPFVMGKAAEAFSRSRRHPGHHHRLALRQSADEAAIRRRRDAGDRRERRRGIPDRRAPTRTRSRCARSSAPARRSRRAISPRRSSRSRCRAAAPARSTVDKDEHPRPDTTMEGARQAQAVRAQSRHHHRRQCLGRERRRRRDDPRQREAAEEARADPAGARARHGLGGGAAARDGHRAGALDPQADGAARPQDRRFRPDRAQ